MNRPPEYENLIKRNVFVAQPAMPGAVQPNLGNAAEFLEAAQQLVDTREIYLPAFFAAYEGLFQMVQAILEFYEVRIKDAGRNAAIQRVCADLKMSNAEFALVSKAHGRRNNTSCISPFPPISRAEAQALIAILRQYLPVATALTQPANI
ncbi:hypothetical protein WJ542_24090 [Paraburkholderia sp. B3]|uniref:hypothetical protein n=1 Tax=Paraburkholderia sp. B3 TaxID=3134791 RepID=UPI0039826607